MKSVHFILCLFYLTALHSCSAKKKKKKKHRKSTTQRKPLVFCLPNQLDAENPDDYCNVVISKYVSKGEKVPLGTTCLSPVNEVHPTQHAVGRALQMCKKKIVEAKFSSKKDFLKYIMFNPAPGVIGRSWGKDWSIYITDHHHMASAISIAHDSVKNIEKYRLLRICTIADLTDMGEADFEDTLLKKGWLWPYDRYGQRIAISRIPPRIAELEDDPFRSLSQYVRDGHGYIKCGIAKTARFIECKNKTDALPFFEFIWANFLRELLAPNGSQLSIVYDVDWQKQIPHFNSVILEAMKLATSRSVVSAYRRLMPGLNLQRKYLHHVRVNHSTGCDSMYTDLILREEYSTISESDTTLTPAAGKMSVPWYESSSHDILFGIAVFVGILVALFVMNYCLRPSLDAEALATGKLNAQKMPSYS